MDNQSQSGADASIRWIRVVVLLCGAIAIYLVGRFIADTIIEQFDLHLRASNEPMLHKAVMTAMVVYILLMIIPFMPAAEIGLGMLLLFGSRIAFLVYVSTVVALLISYIVGRLLPLDFTARAFGLLGLTRAREFVNRMALLSPMERITQATREAPGRLGPALLRHRFIALAVLFNLPGNVLIGGGGGIALMAGMSRLFPFTGYLLAVACAVAPVPLVMFLAEQS